jgi:predicted dehydrogenase
VEEEQLDAVRETITTASTNGFLAEADAFHDLVRHGRDAWTGTSPDESIDIAMALEALAASARQGHPIELAR